MPAKRRKKALHIAKWFAIALVAPILLFALGGWIGSSLPRNSDGVEPDPDLWIGEDTPPLGDADATITLDPTTGTILGDWYALGQRVIDETLASLPDPQASVSRLWPEHFDLGLDIAVDPAAKPGVRCNLGAAAGDEGCPVPPSEVWGARSDPDREPALGVSRHCP